MQMIIKEILIPGFVIDGKVWGIKWKRFFVGKLEFLINLEENRKLCLPTNNYNYTFF